MDERDPERVIIEEPAPRVERETTVIHTGDRGGGGGLIAAIVLLIVVAVGAFLLFGGGLEKATDEIDVNVNVDAPKVELPDIDIDAPEPSNPPAGGNGQ
jgi:hypothetical protein